MWNRISRKRVAAIAYVSDALLSVGKLPRNCYLSSIGSLHSSALFDSFEPDHIIRDTVFCGMDTVKDLAILKSLVECAERAAIQEAFAANLPVIRTATSDGFAAFPNLDIGADLALKEARLRALGEAIERFAWARWWDEPSIAFQAVDIKSAKLSRKARGILKEIGNIVRVDSGVIVQPQLKNSRYEVRIFFLHLEGGGVISGGAAGLLEDAEETNFRALGELARHGLGAAKLQSGALPATFYERRLDFMVKSGRALTKLKRRLEMRGSNPVELPALEIDQSVPHRLSKQISVHRCLFQGQPLFVGGDLERLCL